MAFLNMFVQRASITHYQIRNDRGNERAFPGNDIQEGFPYWFGNKIRELKVKNDPSCTSELFALACGPSYTAVLVDSCVVNGVKFNVHNRDLRRSTQNSGISTPNPSGGMYYGQLEEILEFEYIPFKVVLFKVKWFDTNNLGARIKRCTHRNNITKIMTDRVAFENEPYIISTQATQVFYLDFPGKRGNLKTVQDSYHRKIWNPDIIVVEDNQDVVHDNTSSHVTLSAELDTLNYNTINRDVEPAEVVAPPQPIITDVSWELQAYWELIVRNHFTNWCLSISRARRCSGMSSPTVL
ncbi:hypothetical protein CTI12_AA123200 [Artemisia annua]|uniref:DUF4216 domain-containing protein n=1 Tax=Artemisia annua TaxID=35608 RepID=A0A2U1PQY3_ARTAN|nr:hypothetical protein CTI12_AA123200 [Artemisia annua]